MLALEDPRVKARSKIARLRTAAAGNQISYEAETAQFRSIGEYFVDCLGNDIPLFGAGRLEQTRKPIAQKRSVDRCVGNAERIEASRLSAADPLVSPT